ncbi:MAG: hypothetical protein NTU63_02785 [Candidatus Pacearchaeota archaeon]|nr:hypothetical protein [Candidatus Pacearchaeota archaeon]
MGDWISLAWQIELIAAGVLVYGLIIFLKALIKLDKEFRMALLFILGSLIINVGLGILIGVFISMKIGTDTLVSFWIIQPIVALLAAFLLVVGARKFILALQKQ